MVNFFTMKISRRFFLMLQGAFLVGCGLFFQGEGVLAQEVSPQSPVASRQAGGVKFDATDRLAITNAIFAMTRALDEKDVDLLLAQLTPDFCVEYLVPKSDAASLKGRENFGKMMAQRFENQVAIGMNRRHIFTPLFFIEQTADTARVLLHVITCTAIHQTDWHPFSSAKVEFWLRKENDIWLVYRQFETLDCPLDLPLSKLVPIPQTTK